MAASTGQAEVVMHMGHFEHPQLRVSTGIATVAGKDSCIKIQLVQPALMQAEQAEA